MVLIMVAPVQMVLMPQPTLAVAVVVVLLVWGFSAPARGAKVVPVS